MSTLQIIRHAQASFFGDDYDVLSSLGKEQARVLGRHWAEAERRVDRVFCGPRRRHLETAGAMGEAFAERGRSWPELEIVDDLDEHQGLELVKHELPRWIERDPDLADLAGHPPRDRRRFFRVFRDITRSWVRAEVETPEPLEAWRGFRDRVERGLERIFTASRRGETVLVFTSGGPVAVATGSVLELHDEKVLELSWRVRNTASAELLISDEGTTLNAFNTIDHLRDPRLVTYI